MRLRIIARNVAPWAMTLLPQVVIVILLPLVLVQLLILLPIPILPLLLPLMLRIIIRVDAVYKEKVQAAHIGRHVERYAGEALRCIA